MTRIRDFFADSDWVDREVLRQLSHIRGNWELQWNSLTGYYEHEDDSYAALLNKLIDELDSCDPASHYHDNEDRLGEYVQRRLNWGIRKQGNRWVKANGSVLTPNNYLALLEQGGYNDISQQELIQAAAGRIQAAIHRNQLHFDKMERSHQYLLAGVLAAILYHRGDYEDVDS